MRRRNGHGEEAQAIVEFAIIITILLLFFLGTVDFARFIYYSDAVRSAARVGAEVATNHCPFASYGCGSVDQGTAVPDTYVVWAAYCEASSAVNLNLGQYSIGAANTSPVSTSAYAGQSPCKPGTSSSWAPTCNAAAGATCASCSTDICVAPASRTRGTVVSVSVGYDFRPIMPLMSQFFSTQQCWHTSDSPSPSQDDPTSNGHTLCATSTGQVS